MNIGFRAVPLTTDYYLKLTHPPNGTNLAEANTLSMWKFSATR